jgi:methyl-accepting chemotaxis protein
LSDPAPITPAVGAPSGPRPKHKRKLTNYLLDKQLQLRYVLVVTILSGLIAGTLGYLIYKQSADASASIERRLQDPTFAAIQDTINEDLQSGDQMLVYKMIGAGIALVIILSLYLVIMTHKVAGPLFKVSMYFDRMADGRLTVVTPLRKGDMLQDFFQSFKETHEAIRARAQADVETMDKALVALREQQNQADYRGEQRQKLVDALDGLEQHLTDRKKKLADR